MLSLSNGKKPGLNNMCYLFFFEKLENRVKSKKIHSFAMSASNTLFLINSHKMVGSILISINEMWVLKRVLLAFLYDIMRCEKNVSLMINGNIKH